MICLDWPGHRRLYEQSETTWRKSPDEKREDWLTGCGWCGGVFVAEQVPTPPAEPGYAGPRYRVINDPMPDGVEGVKIGGRA